VKYVTKEAFREIYFRLGGGERGGWTQSYWDKFFEPTPPRPMKYRIEEPASPAHTSMMIVSDYAIDEYRLFFMTDEDNDNLFVWPERDEEPEPPLDNWTQRP
jgi:hypothetical protein